MGPVVDVLSLIGDAGERLARAFSESASRAGRETDDGYLRGPCAPFRFPTRVRCAATSIPGVEAVSIATDDLVPRRYCR